MVRTRLEVGDIVTIPLTGDEVAVAQVVGTYKQAAHFFAVFAGRCESRDETCIESCLDGEIVFLALSLDAKVSAGDWVIAGHRDVNGPGIPFPAYVEGTFPPGSYEVVDYSGQQRRAATAEELETLPARKVVAPVRLEKAVRAFYGLEAWAEAYDELRAPPEWATTRFRLGDR